MNAFEKEISEILHDFGLTYRVESPDSRKENIADAYIAIALAVERHYPVPTDKHCYDCGMEIFKYDGAYRCIYDGFYEAINKNNK